MSVADSIREARQAAGLSRRELGRLSGLTAQTVFNVETGRVREPAFSTICRLARALVLPVEALCLPEVATESVADSDASTTVVGLRGSSMRGIVSGSQPSATTKRGGK